MKSKEFTSLESFVMQALTKGDHPLLRQVNDQFQVAELKKRELTGSGFFTYFSVPKEKQLEGINKINFGDVGARIQGLKNDAGFVLFIKDGLINALEGYTYGNEAWPEDDSKFELYYLSGKKRDLQDLLKKIDQ